jgi:hypothetical protein
VDIIHVIAVRVLTTFSKKTDTSEDEGIIGFEGRTDVLFWLDFIGLHFVKYKVKV